MSDTPRPDDLAEQQTIAPSGAKTPPKPRRNAIGQTGIPQVLGRYTIQKDLGRGAMGAVFLAHDSELDRQVALKTPLGEVAEGSEFLERFRREARAAAILRHSNICPSFDVGEIDGVHHISMAFIEGKPLSEFVDENNPMPIRRAVQVVRKVASALAEAHRHQIIHRDLKPGNVMIDRKGEPIVMDFGLARSIQPKDGEQLTQDGIAMGSPGYMSPEQFEGDPEAIGAVSDIYSLGVMTYELLTGTLPFRGSIIQIMAQILKERPKPPSQLRPDVDARLDKICLKMMARESDRRFSSMEEVVSALTKFLKAGTEKTVEPEPSSVPSYDSEDERESPRPSSDERGSRSSNGRGRRSSRRKQRSSQIKIGAKEVSLSVLLSVGIAIFALMIFGLISMSGGFGNGLDPPDAVAINGTSGDSQKETSVDSESELASNTATNRDEKPV